MIVISLGGSIVRPSENFDKEFVKSFAKTVSLYKAERFIIVVGGGYMARVKANEYLTRYGNKFYADIEAIKITRENARFVRDIFKSKQKIIPRTFDNLKRIASKHRISFMGGTIPGITTDADAVLCAEMLSAKMVINISNVAYIYNKDPKKYSDAVPIPKMTHKELVSLAVKNDTRNPGGHFVFDSLAAKLSYRSNIPLFFCSKNVKDIRKIIEGKKHEGTTVIN